MLKIKIIFSKLIWKIAGISPKMGNLVMDVFGEKNYIKISRLKNLTIS